MPCRHICAYLSSEPGQAQLTSRIYGAVVDEITEEQGACSVLIPVPRTEAEKKIVGDINAAALASARTKDAAVRLAQELVTGVQSLLPELKAAGTAEFQIEHA